MIETSSQERVDLCAARALGISENLNDALVLAEALKSSGVIDISIPEQSMMVSISGGDFIKRLENALIQFDDDGSWMTVSREDVEKCGGVLDDIRGQTTIYYRIADGDGSIPNPPLIQKKGDRIVVWH